jgi:DNA-directed RNA polymerase specialized sigma24 family protein
MTAETTLGELLDEGRRISIIEAHRRGLSHPDAEDAAQAVSVKLWLAIKTGKQIKSIEAWVRRTTSNFIVDSHRHKSRLKNGPGMLETLAGIDESRI